MKKLLLTRNVFLDTQVFFQLGFEFNGSRLAEFARLCEKQLASLVVTDITVREIRANMKGRISAASRGLLSFRRDNPILLSLPGRHFAEFLRPFDKGKANAEMNGQLDAFLARCRAEILTADNTPAGNVFHRYFAQEAPFHGGNREEFPDAFSIEILARWCGERGQKAYVVSLDEGFRSAADTTGCLIPLKDLAEFMDLVNRQQTVLADYAEEIFESATDEIEECLKDKLENASFFLDLDGDVESIQVEDLSFDRELLLEVNDHSATFVVTVQAEVTAEVTYGDPEMAVYDKEEGNITYLDYVDKAVTEILTYPAEVTIKFIANDQPKVGLSCVSTSKNSSFLIHADE